MNATFGTTFCTDVMNVFGSLAAACTSLYFASDRTVRPEPLEQRIRTIEGLRFEGIEIVWQAVAHESARREAKCASFPRLA